MSQPLNLPVLDQLSSCRNLLIAGMGGGFDIFCGLPIYWFFDLPAVAERNLFLDDLCSTDTFSEALRATLMARARLRVRAAARIPLT